MEPDSPTIGPARPAGSPLVQLALLVPDASFAVARQLQRAAFGICGFGTRRSAAVIEAVASAPVMARPLALVEARVAPLARRGAEQRQADVLRLGVVVQQAQPMVVELIDRVVEYLPIDAILAKIDIDALLRRVDVDGIVGRVDINSIVARVDLQGIVAEVLAGIEIGDLIHDSTSSMVTDARDTVRSTAVTVDSRMARIVDRIVRGGRARDEVLPGYAVPGVS